MGTDLPVPVLTLMKSKALGEDLAFMISATAARPILSGLRPAMCKSPSFDGALGLA